MIARLIIVMCFVSLPGCALVESLVFLPIDPVGLGTGTHTPVLPCWMYPESLDPGWRSMCQENRRDAWGSEREFIQPAAADSD